MRDIRNEMMTIIAKDFKDWYNTLTEQEKKEYSKIIDNLRDGRNTNNTSNVEEK